MLVCKYNYSPFLNTKVQDDLIVEIQIEKIIKYCEQFLFSRAKYLNNSIQYFVIDKTNFCVSSD